ncbi:MAG: hypothetical protein AAF790_01915 [Planctomycetota bacterium]
MKRFATALAATLLLSSPTLAHFPWLATDADGRVLLYFGESPAEKTYHLPEAVEKATVMHTQADGEKTAVSMEVIDEPDFIGRRSSAPVEGDGPLSCDVVYGVYHGAKLCYYAQHMPTLKPAVETADGGTAGGAAPASDSGGLAVKLTAGDQASLTAAFTWRGEPLAEASASLVMADGSEADTQKTDAEGVARFDLSAVEPGTLAIRLGHTLKDQAGEIDGKAYQAEMHYLTATFTHTASTAPAAEPPAPAVGAKLPDLPAAIASFGGAVADGWLYVYSGHSGTVHAHSRENLSKHFCRVKLDGSTDWEPLPIDAPLQGLPLVSHGGMLYRVGGLDARNLTEEEEEQLYSTDTFARFDPSKMRWETLPPLPEPRSSHDAVVIGDKLYVVGGWTLAGDDDGTWLDTAWAFDLTDPASNWQPLTNPPFRRRAIAAGALDGHLVVLGGMNDEPDISRRVDALNLETGEWRTLADFPADGLKGFGASAWLLDGALYASAADGVLRSLSDVDGQWQDAGKLQTPRFFHRLLPGGEGRLIAIAGASPVKGHLAEAEWLKP